MKNKNQVLSRVEMLIKEGESFDLSEFVLDPAHNGQNLAVQTWLGQAVLVINVALPSAHPFRKQAAAYFAGGGMIGVDGMLALLRGLAREIKAGTFD